MKNMKSLMLITVVEGIWVNESVRKSYNLVINGYRVMKSIYLTIMP